MTKMDVLAAPAPPALRCIRASLPKNVGGAMEGGSRRAGSDGPGSAGYVSQVPEAAGGQETIRRGFPGSVSVSRKGEKVYCFGAKHEQTTFSSLPHSQKNTQILSAQRISTAPVNTVFCW